ncbi:MAG TPA: NUDIX hydrolase [Arthrobacter sp.]|nr:NUDIX hydrolase [Arthrobacter sp.]
MAHPVPRAPKRTPLTVSMGSGSMPPAHTGLPTVEEVSAGGVVVDTTDKRLHVAIIARINRGGRLEWCLPKGHPENEETNEEAAIREIEEETGISGRLLAPLGTVDYWFTVSGHRVHKTVHHFLLEATGGELTTENDPDHEAVDVAWVPIKELPKRLSFPNERRIADLAREVLPGHV